MTTSKQAIALYTLIRHEMMRMFRIASQVFLPPVITTALYFLIFGYLIGQRIGLVHGVSYAEFIAPGLIMMSVINNAYSNVSTSLFSMRFQKSIEEILVSPISNGLLLLGFITGGIIRGLSVALLVWFVSCWFVHLPVYHFGLTLLTLLLVSSLFSLAGFTNALVARSFDDVMLIPTFILAPLTYLGGVFYSTTMLSPFWQTVSHFNPILYMVNALRYAMIGQENVDIWLAMSIISGLVIALALLNLFLLKRGQGLRD
ncbi:MAG: ABC transporter permease [Legionella sp.]|nr:ABC transporter permease [Legionella sp.]